MSVLWKQKHLKFILFIKENFKIFLCREKKVILLVDTRKNAMYEIRTVLTKTFSEKHPFVTAKIEKKTNRLIQKYFIYIIPAKLVEMLLKLLKKVKNITVCKKQHLRSA